MQGETKIKSSWGYGLSSAWCQGIHIISWSKQYYLIADWITVNNFLWTVELIKFDENLFSFVYWIRRKTVW